MTSYPAFICKEEGTCYGVDFPDFPGCISAGDTVEDVLANAHEALRFHIDGMLEDGDDIPGLSDTEQAFASLDRGPDEFAMVAAVRIPAKGKAVRVTMTMDNNLLRKVDAHARAQGYSRSAFVAEACRRLMG